MKKHKFSPEFEKEVAWFGMLRASVIAHQFDGIVESPIELTMATALAFIAEQMALPCELIRPEDRVGKAKACFIAPQQKFESYRLDLIVGDNRTGRAAVVECDGRDFHYSRWDQISRDRKRDADLELAGYHVFRFPGTQIYNEPFASAQEVWGRIDPLEMLPFLKMVVAFE